MMCRTHIVIGIASGITAAAIAGPLTAEVWYSAVLGAAVGSILPDIDTRAGRRKSEVFWSGIAVAALTAVILVLDSMSGTGICDAVLARADDTLLQGGILLGLLLFGMKLSGHRSFSHSLAALLMLLISLKMVCPVLVPFFAVGFVSHLLLDMLNRKPVKLFYPFGRGFALRFCSADGKMNNVLFAVGCFWLLAATAYLTAI